MGRWTRRLVRLIGPAPNAGPPYWLSCLYLGTSRCSTTSVASTACTTGPTTPGPASSQISANGPAPISLNAASSGGAAARGHTPTGARPRDRLWTWGVRWPHAGTGFRCRGYRAESGGRRVRKADVRCAGPAGPARNAGDRAGSEVHRGVRCAGACEGPAGDGSSVWGPARTGRGTAPPDRLVSRGRSGVEHVPAGRAHLSHGGGHPTLAGARRLSGSGRPAEPISVRHVGRRDAWPAPHAHHGSGRRG